MVTLRTAAFLAYLIAWIALCAGALWSRWSGHGSGKSHPEPEPTPVHYLGTLLQCLAALPVVLGLDPGPLRPPAANLLAVLIAAPLAVTLFWGALLAGRSIGLVTTGPFAWLRHPIYAAFLWMLLATAALVGTPIGTLLAIMLYVSGTELRIRQEERDLRDRFGAAYGEYQRRVRWRYLPPLR